MQPPSMQPQRTSKPLQIVIKKTTRPLYAPPHSSAAATTTTTTTTIVPRNQLTLRQQEQLEAQRRLEEERIARERQEEEKRKQLEEERRIQEEERRRQEEERKRLEEEERKRKEEERRIQEEEDAKRRAEEEQARKLAEEVKHKAELLQKEEDYQKQKMLKKRIRACNLAVSMGLTPRPEEQKLRTFDSTVKRNTAYIKKLRSITEDQRDSLLAEVKSLNLTKYVSEAVIAITEGKFAKQGDFSTTIKICSVCHSRYAEFTPLLIQALTKHFQENSYKPVVPPQPPDPQKQMRQRIALRLLCELYINGFFIDPSPIVSILRELVKGDEPTPTTEGFFNLPIIVGFVRSVGEDILGIVPKLRRQTFEQLKEAVGQETAIGVITKVKKFFSIPNPDEDPIWAILSLPNPSEALTTKTDMITTPEQQKLFFTLMEGYFFKVSDYLLAQHKQLQEKEKENHTIMETRGELSAAQVAIYDQLRKNYEKLLSNTTMLSDMLDLAMPQLESGNVTRVADSADKSAKKDDLSEQPLWDDEDTRSFYESLPKVSAWLATTPPEEPPKDEKPATKSSSTTSTTSTTSATPAVSNPPQTTVPASSESETPKEKPKVKKGEETKTDDKAAGFPLAQLSPCDKWLIQLPMCISRDLIDKASEDFFTHYNTKLNRKKLLGTLFHVPRTQLELLPYYSRLTATLSQEIKEIGPKLCSMLEEEFKELVSRKDQINIETKIRNIRFLGELTKFKVCPRELIFACFQACLNDFSHHNIDVACNLLETCGRFLYRSPETHVRTKNMLEVMMRLKNVKNLDSRMNTMIENAFYTSVPPERSLHTSKNRTPMQNYIRFLIFDCLSVKTVKHVLKQMRKLHWDEQEDYMVKCLLNVHKGKFVSIPLLASLISGIAVHHDTLGVKVVDSLCEEIRVGLERNDYSAQQRRIMHVKLLSELYNYTMFEHQLIFETLYLFLTFGHDNSSIASGEDLVLDSPRDYFRIRLICTVLLTCGQYFSKGSIKFKLDKFLAFFQRYLLSKISLPMDVEFMVMDMLEALRPQMMRVTTVEEAEKLIQQVDAEYQQHLAKRAGAVNSNGTQQMTTVKPVNVQITRGKAATTETPTSPSEEDTNSEANTQVQAEDNEFDRDQESPDSPQSQETPAPVLRQTRRPPTSPADEDFERELSRVMKESYASGHRRTETLKVEIPYQVEVAAANSSHNTSQYQFKVLMKKGNKQKTKNLLIPATCKLAKATKNHTSSEKTQQAALKRVVMKSLEEDTVRDQVPPAIGRGTSKPAAERRRQPQSLEVQLQNSFGRT
ncbi:regulator of nonsense transcripts UPF2 [Pelomyxa schiedti]|nr:regulator of nonsense transcripts UPF2 [Pelomyxa schiedti]